MIANPTKKPATQSTATIHCASIDRHLLISKSVKTSAKLSVTQPSQEQFMIDCPTVKHTLITHITKPTFCSKQTFLTDFQMYRQTRYLQLIDSVLLSGSNVY